MKEKLVLVIILFLSSNIEAQQTAIDKAADSTCKCLEANKDKIKDSKSFDRMGQNCVTKSTVPYLKEIAKEENISLDSLDTNNGRMVGQKIGIKLMVQCPVFLALLSKYGMDDKNNNKIEESSSGKIDGIVISVETGSQAAINIRDPGGSITRLLWIEYFDGADQYKQNPQKLKGKKVTVSWKGIKYYMMQQKDFILVKEITSLEVH